MYVCIYIYIYIYIYIRFYISFLYMLKNLQFHDEISQYALTQISRPQLLKIIIGLK